MNIEETEFLAFHKTKKESKKTYDVIVLSKDKSLVLGLISWYSPWRRYVFKTISDRLFDTKCLTDVINYIDRLMSERENEE